MGTGSMMPVWLVVHEQLVVREQTANPFGPNTV
jgi:hypothetical protein